jgi:hypothetical protein
MGRDKEYLRPTGLETGLESPAYKDLKDCTVVSGEPVVGRIYEERGAREELRWYWAINGVSVTCRKWGADLGNESPSGHPDHEYPED